MGKYTINWNSPGGGAGGGLFTFNPLPSGFVSCDFNYFTYQIVAINNDEFTNSRGNIYYSSGGTYLSPLPTPLTAIFASPQNSVYIDVLTSHVQHAGGTLMSLSDGAGATVSMRMTTGLEFIGNYSDGVISIDTHLATLSGTIALDFPVTLEMSIVKSLDSIFWFFKDGIWRNAASDADYGLFIFKDGSWRQHTVDPSYQLLGQLDSSWTP